jgi:ubiquinone/menaquinone biosynthesis C-methylase UbiE
MIPGNSWILDVGCGPGHYARFFSNIGFEVVGIDLSKSMLSIARKASRENRLAQMDMWDLGFPEGTFDALWVCASFPHAPEVKAAAILMEFRRVLKDQGFLFVGVMAGDDLVRIETAEEMGDYHRIGRFFQRYRDRSHFEEYLNACDFEILDVVERVVHSQVLEKALCKTNTWLNFYCRKGNRCVDENKHLS